jgi:hypothetical protein
MAFDGFSRLANDGDAESARIALQMHVHGPALYGRYWSATAEELAAWSSLAQQALRRKSQSPGSGGQQDGFEHDVLVASGGFQRNC